MSVRIFLFSSVMLGAALSVSTSGCADSTNEGFADDDSGTHTWHSPDGGGGGALTDASGTDAASVDAPDDSGTTSSADAGLADAATLDAGSDAAVIVAPADAGTDAGSTSPVDAGPELDDPFDPASCSGPAITFAQAAAKFPSGASSVALGSYKLMARSRSCNSVTGCSAWGTPTQAKAPPPHGYDTGDFVLGGTFRIITSGSNLEVSPLDDTCKAAYSYCNASLSFPSTETSGTLTFPQATEYQYVAMDIYLIPPNPDPQNLFQTYTLTMTDSCAEVHSAETATSGPATTQYGLLVRY